MPYINKEDRERYRKPLETLIYELQNAEIEDSDNCIGNIRGHIAYIVFKILKEMYAFDGAKYSDRSEALAVLSSVDDEFKSRFLRPYEQEKRTINGDV